MSLLFISLALVPHARAENVPCAAEASGPGWHAALGATIVGGALSHGRQEVTVDIPAIDQGDSPYEYNDVVGHVPAPMARVRIVEEADAGVPGRQTLVVTAPEVYAPTDALLAGLSGTTSAPLRAALRFVAGGQTVGWFPAELRASPADLPSTNVSVYVVTLGGNGVPSAEASRALDAMAQTGTLRVETVVARSDGDGGRLPFPDHDDAAATELAGSFTLDMATLTPAMTSLQGLQTQLGGQLATGKCGDLPTTGGGKK